MNCRHLKNNLEAYVRNELDAESEKQVAAHLSICDNCRRLHDAVFVIHIALKDMPTHRARGDFNQRALEKLGHLQAAQTTVQRVDQIAHARLSPWRRFALWLDGLVPRGLFRYSSPAMVGVALGLFVAIAIILSPSGQHTLKAITRASEIPWLKQLAPSNWADGEPQATPFATPLATPLSGANTHSRHEGE
jgi:anti-sigma factor RsiW